MLPLFTSSMRDARRAIIFAGGALCCELAIAESKHRARLRNMMQLGGLALAICVSSTICHPERSRRIPISLALLLQLQGIHRALLYSKNSLARHWHCRITRGPSTA